MCFLIVLVICGYVCVLYCVVDSGFGLVLVVRLWYFVVVLVTGLYIIVADFDVFLRVVMVAASGFCVWVCW